MATWFRRAFVGVVLALGCFVSWTAVAAVDMFLKLDGIKGESRDARHKDEINVVSWSWGTSGGNAKPVVQTLNVTKTVDVASPKLFENALTGRRLKSATLVVRKAGGAAVEFIKIKLEDVEIDSIAVGSSGDTATEQVSFAFRKITFEYIPQDDKGGAGPAVSMTYEQGK